MPDAPQAIKKTIRSRDFRTVYSNGSRFRIGDNDASMTFLIETDDETGSMIHEDQVQVIMTPRSLKVLHMVITHGLTQLEQLMGPIDLGAEKIAEIQNALNASVIKK
jgi:hypothetical protein